MASGHNYPNSIIASVADYDENAKEEVDDSRKIANSAAKRSSQQMTPAPPASDLVSDSGVNLKSTKAAAKASSMTAGDSNSQTSTGPSRRRATESGASDAQVVQNSNTAPAPTKKKRRVVVQCKDPDCPECVAARERGRKATRKVTISTNTTPEKSPAKKAKSDTQPSRPSQNPSRPAPYPVQSHGLRRPSASAGPRPKSMYTVPTKIMASGHLPTMYNTRGTYPAPGYSHPGTVAIIERPGPINRTISARQAHPVSIHAGANGLVNYNPNGGPKLSARRTIKTSVVESDSESEDEPGPEQRQSQRRQVALRQQRPVQAIESESESEDEDEEEEDSEELDEDEEEAAQAAAFAEAERRRRLLQQQKLNAPAEMRQRIAAAEARNLAERQQQQQQQQAQLLQHQGMLEQQRLLEQQQQQKRMPPPIMPASMAQAAGPKLSMRKANPVAQITYGGRHPSMHEDGDAIRSAFRDHSVGTSENRRPSIASSGGTKATSYSHPNAAGNARIIVEGNRGRRLSYVGAENHAGLAAMHAQFSPPPPAVPDFERIIANAVRQQMESLQLSPTQTGRSRMDLDDQVQEALRYQQGSDANAPRDLPQIPLTAEALRRKQNNLSHAGSAHSNRSSDEDQTRISASHRLTAGSDSGNVTVTGDEMKVRIDTSNGFEMEFEGRRVTLLPAGDGTADLIIGGKRETAYHSTLGSIVNGATINGSRIGGSKLGRTPAARETTREFNRDFSREPLREPVREYVREPPLREFTREPSRDFVREPTRDPRDRDPRDREPKDREAERVRERVKERRDRERDREDRRQQAREWKQAEYNDDYESELEYVEPPRRRAAEPEYDEPPRRRAGGRPRAETYESERTERAAPVRRPPPPSPRYSARNDRAERDDREDEYDDYPPPQRRSRQEAPYAPGPSHNDYNGRGPKGPPSAVFGA